MGYKYTDAVFKAKLDGLTKQVLLAICWYANNKTGICWPSHAQVAAAVGLGETSAKKFRRQLKDMGLIVVKGQHKTYGGFVDILWVNLKEIEKLTGPPEGAPEESDSEGSGDTSWLEEIESESVAEQPTPQARDASPSGVERPPLRRDAPPNQELDLEVNRELKPVSEKPERQGSSPAVSEQDQGQERKSTTRGVAPNPTGGSSPPDPSAGTTSVKIGVPPPRCQARVRGKVCGGPLRNNNQFGVCLKCGFDPNKRLTEYVEEADRKRDGGHKWPSPRRRDSECLNGCGSSYWEWAYGKEECTGKAEGAGA